MCDKYVKPKIKYKLFTSNSHKDFDNCKHIVLYLKYIDLKDVDEAFSLYIIEHNNKFEYYLVKCQFYLVFNFNQYCPFVTSNLTDNKTMISWSIFSEKISSDFKGKGYTFNQMAEMHIITVAKKLDMSCDFYIKHNIHTVE